MIKIRYRDPQELSPGLHAEAERQGRTTTVYLLPGLTAAQRRAALRRLRIAARRGYAPRLPTSQLAVALLADRVRTTVGRAGAVFRSHPAGSTVPVMVVSAGAIAFLALSAVSIQVIHPPHNPGQGSLAGSAVSGIPLGGGSGPGGSPRPGSGGTDGPGQDGSAGLDPQAAGSLPGTGVPGANGTGTSGNAAGGGTDSSPGVSSGSNGGTTLSGGQSPSPAPDRSSGTPVTGSSSAAAAPTATATAAATPSASKSSNCLNVGPLGICL